MTIFRRWSSYYNHLLGRHKYPVQIISGGVLWFTGDVISQVIYKFANPTTHDAFSPSSHQSDEGFGSRTQLEDGSSRGFIDWKRVGRMTFYGMTFSAPIYAFWYSFLEALSLRIFSQKSLLSSYPLISKWRGSSLSSSSPFPRPTSKPSLSKTSFLNETIPSLQQSLLSPEHSHASKYRIWKIIAFKSFADVVLFDPVYLCFFFVMTSTLESKSWIDINTKLRDEFKHTYLIDVSVWLPIQILNFRLVPVKYQALAVQCCNIGWNTFLSYVQHKHPVSPSLNG
jgi:Mpv17 / PMP22 family